MFVIFNTKLYYYLYATVDPTYGTNEDQKFPNTIELTVDGETVKSDEVRLWRTSVNTPTKSIDKTEISEKTETVTYTISNVVNEKESSYQYYNSYSIVDTLESILELKATDDTVHAKTKNTTNPITVPSLFFPILLVFLS